MKIRQLLKSLCLIGFTFLLVTCSSRLPLLVNPSDSSELLVPSTCRLVPHALGQTCVPLHPQRIATLTDVDLANALVLGIQPIATTFYSNPPDVPSYFKGKLDQLQAIGTDGQPSIERILQIKPDLILGLEHSVLPIFPLLSHIAPAVAGSWQGTSSWRDYFNFVAEVLNRKAEAQQAWARYYQRIQDLRVALEMGDIAPGQQRQPLKISVFHICCGSLHIDTKNSFNGSILADVGFLRPKSQDIIVEGGVEFISEELIPEIDADVLFIPTDLQDKDSDRKLSHLMQNPLWQSLEAVKQGKVYLVDYHTWRSANLVAADGVIDDLFKYLLATES
jgi:iron complex transport system substrate-binding protein